MERNETLILALAQVCQGLAGSRDFGDAARKAYAVLAELYDRGAAPAAGVAAIKDSIGDDYIVCLEDGRKMKMLKRYLKTHFNMTEKEYKEKWGLPADYPMIAPAYAKARSNLARKFGFGARR
ncbi:MAG: MucR family transcriptional regulator [Rickettsiales bacterium]|jgi:predicted transcriptional regulator|nr:MucR family transcriptional regulator [Rickettsiales bacterium]